MPTIGSVPAICVAAPVSVSVSEEVAGVPLASVNNKPPAPFNASGSRLANDSSSVGVPSTGNAPGADIKLPLLPASFVSLKYPVLFGVV